MLFSEKYKLLNGKNIDIRIADISDCKEIVNVLNSIIKERTFTMSLNYFNMDEEVEFFKNLNQREAILIAVLDEKIVGYSIVTIPDVRAGSTLHVGELGTYVMKEYRNLGIGNFLLNSVFKFAKANNFEKLVIRVRASNINALNFYKKAGFGEIGKLKKHIKINGKYEDHVLMEKFLI